MKRSTVTYNRNRRRLLAVIALVLVLLTFSPLILRPGKINPKLLSMPFTLWAGIGITVLMVILTFLAGKFQDDE